MDKFKQYIQEHTNELDSDIPSKELWKAINTQLSVDDKRKPIVFYSIFRYVIAACLIGLIVIATKYFINEKPTIKNNIAVVQKKIDTNLIAVTNNKKTGIATTIKHAVRNTSLQKAEASAIQFETEKINVKDSSNTENTLIQSVDKSFATLIALQTDKVSKTPIFAESPAYFNDFYLQIHQLDEDEKIIKKDIIANGLSNEMLLQIINIYKQKLLVLQSLQKEINKTNTRFKQQRKTTAIQKNYFLHL